MKRPVLTAILLLFHLLSFPQVSASLPAVMLLSQAIPLGDKTDLRIREMRLHAKVDPADGYKNGTLDVSLIFNGRPSAGVKTTVELRSAGDRQGRLPATPIRKTFA